MSKPVIVLGGGGHAGVLVDILKQQGVQILAIVAPVNPTLDVLQGIPVLNNDIDVFKYNVKEIEIVNGIGSLPGNILRSKLYGFFKQNGCTFKSIIADCAFVSKYTKLAEGVQVLRRAVLQTGVTIGENSIINTGAIVEHDCKIGEQNHLAPGVCLSGQVTTGSHVHIGTGACVIQSIVVGDRSVIGAGAVVNQDIFDNQTIYPARGFIK